VTLSRRRIASIPGIFDNLPLGPRFRAGYAIRANFLASMGGCRSRGRVDHKRVDASEGVCWRRACVHVLGGAHCHDLQIRTGECKRTGIRIVRCRTRQNWQVGIPGDLALNASKPCSSISLRFSKAYSRMDHRFFFLAGAINPIYLQQSVGFLLSLLSSLSSSSSHRPSSFASVLSVRLAGDPNQNFPSQILFQMVPVAPGDIIAGQNFPRI